MTKILIVDDSPVIRKVARRIFETLRLQVEEATNGNEGLDACARSMPDAVMVDWQMPEADGFAFVRGLRRLPGGDKPIVLFCMSEYDVSLVARARTCGADDIVLKPFDGEILGRKAAEHGLAA